MGQEHFLREGEVYMCIICLPVEFLVQGSWFVVMLAVWMHSYFTDGETAHQ